MPRFSVVIPAYNAQHCIAHALQSIVNQVRPVDEVIVVDDGSTDRTVEIVLLWQNRLPIILLRNGMNLGIGASLRYGVNAATCDWVLRLDADDRWLPGHVGALEFATRQANVCLVAAPAIFVDQAGSRLGESQPVQDAQVRALLMWDNPLIHSGTGFARAAYLDAGGYRQSVLWEDYDLWIRLLSMGRLGTSVTPSIEYLVSGTSLSRTKRSLAIAARWQCQRLAVMSFWRHNPVAAGRSLTLGAGRALFARLF